MTEIFITNIQNTVEANNILHLLKTENPELNVNFDFAENEKKYPCGHTILRVEGEQITSKNILRTMHNAGFKCDILEDNICI